MSIAATAGRRRYHARAALAAGAAVLSFAGAAAGHAADLSRSDLVVDADGRVAVRVVLAASDAARVARGPRPEDELTALVRRALLVRADGVPCPTEELAVRGDEDDGVAVTGAFACPPARLVEVTCHFAGEPDLGDRHRHLATLVAGERTSARLLTTASRTVTLELPAPPREPARTLGGHVAVRVAAAVGGLVAIAIGLRAARRRGRIARRTWT